MLSTSLYVFGEKSVAQAHVVKSMHGIQSQAFCQTSDVMIARALLYEEAICEIKRFTILVNGLKTSGGGGGVKKPF